MTCTNRKAMQKPGRAGARMVQKRSQSVIASGLAPFRISFQKSATIVI
jgi:hypothetical protein